MTFIEFLIWLWGQCSYVFAVIIATCFVAFKMPKRNKFWLRLTLSFILATLVKMGLDLLLIRNKTYDGITVVNLTIAVILYFSVALAIYVSFKCSPYAALFCSTIGYGFQHISFNIYAIYLEYLLFSGISHPLWVKIIVLLAITVIVYSILYLTMIRPIKHCDVVLDNKKQILIVIGFILASIFLDTMVLVKLNDIKTVVVFETLAIVACLMGLMLEIHNITSKNKELELDFASKLKTEEMSKLEYDKEIIDVLNIKAHDLKHQIMTDGSIPPEAYEEAKTVVDEYENLYMTGSPALDAVLTRKTFSAKNAKVTITCLADGEKISFMKDIDIYSLFGNLIDNAIEAASQMDNQSKRTVSISVMKKDYFININVSNYYNGKLKIDEGELQTTKDDRLYHGFGLKSVKSIVEKYHGNMIVQNKDETFSVDIIFPL